MSTQRGNVKKTGQRHQNTFAYKHNRKSKLTERILSSPNNHVCAHCHEQIEWRKRYRKYKPLTQPKKCVECTQKTVMKAYHVICDQCSEARGVCGKCLQPRDVIVDQSQQEQQDAKEELTLQRALAPLSERKRRAVYRALERGEDRAAIVAQLTGPGGREEDGPDDDSDEDSPGSVSDSDSEAENCEDLANTMARVLNIDSVSESRQECARHPIGVLSEEGGE